MKEIDIYREIIRKHFKELSDMEPVLGQLREVGASQIESVKAPCYELQMPLAEADRLVLNSETWQDFRDGNISIREKFWGGI